MRPAENRRVGEAQRLAARAGFGFDFAALFFAAAGFFAAAVVFFAAAGFCFGGDALAAGRLATSFFGACAR